MDLLAVAIAFCVVAFWVTTTRAVEGMCVAALLLTGVWLAAAISNVFEPLPREQLIMAACLTWWVPLTPWAVLRLTWVQQLPAMALQNALAASRWARTDRIRIWRLPFWWPMARVDLGSIGRGRLVFGQGKFEVWARLSLRGPAFARAPWFYGELDPGWPAWTRGMRRHRTPGGEQTWHYWGGQRGRSFLDDRQLRDVPASLHENALVCLLESPAEEPCPMDLVQELSALQDVAILSWPGHLSLVFKWYGSVGTHLGEFSTRADGTLDALERIARRWAALSSGSAVAPT